MANAMNAAMVSGPSQRCASSRGLPAMTSFAACAAGAGWLTWEAGLEARSSRR